MPYSPGAAKSIDRRELAPRGSQLCACYWVAVPEAVRARRVNMRRYAAIFHQGTTVHSGHYFAYVREGARTGHLPAPPARRCARWHL
jgi:hypothetical protein